PRRPLRARSALGISERSRHSATRSHPARPRAVLAPADDGAPIRRTGRRADRRRDHGDRRRPRSEGASSGPMTRALWIAWALVAARGLVAIAEHGREG